MNMNILRHLLVFSRSKRRCNSPRQRAISAKIDTRTDAMMEDEIILSGIKRNTLINAALDWYLKAIDEARNKPSSPCREPEPYPDEVDGGDKYILSRLPEKDKEFLEFMKAQMGTSLYHAISLGLHLLKEDYNKHPFMYLPEE